MFETASDCKKVWRRRCGYDKNLIDYKKLQSGARKFFFAKRIKTAIAFFFVCTKYYSICFASVYLTNMKLDGLRHAKSSV